MTFPKNRLTFLLKSHKKGEKHQFLPQKVLILLFERNGSMGQV